MRAIEQFKTPIGQINMIIHRGGEYDKTSGTIIGGEILSEKEIPNLIVDTASQLMACRLAPGSQPGSNEGTLLPDGLQYLAVGVGILNNPNAEYHKTDNPVNVNAWDLQDPPKEDTSIAKLKGEIQRKPFTTWCFVNTDGTDISDPTKISNVLKLVTTFYETEAIGPLTEMGLYGGNATITKNSGIMFNYKTYPVWNKPNDARLTITWKLTF